MGQNQESENEVALDEVRLARLARLARFLVQHLSSQ